MVSPIPLSLCCGPTLADARRGTPRPLCRCGVKPPTGRPGGRGRRPGARWSQRARGARSRGREAARSHGLKVDSLTAWYTSIGLTRPAASGLVRPRSASFGADSSLTLARSKEKWCIIHFFHPDFPRCRIMDKKLDVSAPFLRSFVPLSLPHVQHRTPRTPRTPRSARSAPLGVQFYPARLALLRSAR